MATNSWVRGQRVGGQRGGGQRNGGQRVGGWGATDGSNPSTTAQSYTSYSRFASRTATTGARTDYAGSSKTPLSPSNKSAISQKLRKLDKVQVQGVALLKIIKHSIDALPETCSGTLLGLDMNQSLEVTSCFPHPYDPTVPAPTTAAGSGTKNTTSVAEDASQYQMKMMGVLRDIFVDNCCVGWYKTTNMGAFCTTELLEEQFNYQMELDQENVARCVVLIFDPAQTKKGNLYLKAYRIKSSFVKYYQEQQNKANSSNPSLISRFTLENQAQAAAKTAQLTAQSPQLSVFENEVFEELPVEISNATPVQLYLRQLAETEKLDQVVSANLDLSSSPFLEQSLERLIHQCNRVEQEDSKMQYYERQLAKNTQLQQQWLQQRRAENKARQERGEPPLPEFDSANPIFKNLQPPNKVEASLARSQLEVYCNNVNSFASKSFPKLFASQNIQG